MSFADLVSLAWRGAIRRPVQSGLLILAAATAMGLHGGVVLLSEAGEAGMKLGLARLGADLLVVPEGTQEDLYDSLVTSQTTDQVLNAEQVGAIAGSSLVAETTAQLYAKSLSGASCCSVASVLIIGFEPHTDFVVRPWLAGRPRTRLSAQDVLVGSDLGLAEGDELKLYGTSLRVAGVLDPTALSLDVSVFVPMDTLIRMATASAKQAEKPLELSAGQASTVLVRLTPQAARLPVDQVATWLERDVPGVEVVVASELMVQLRTRLEAALAGLSSVRLLVGPAAALLGALALGLSVHLRRRDLGLLRALGATARDVATVVLLEAVGLAVLGVTLGLGVATLGVFAFQRLIADAMSVPLSMPSLERIAVLWAAGGAAAVIVALVAAAVPAFAISRLAPVDTLAMRHRRTT